MNPQEEKKKCQQTHEKVFYLIHKMEIKTVWYNFSPFQSEKVKCVISPSIGVGAEMQIHSLPLDNHLAPSLKT